MIIGQSLCGAVMRLALAIATAPVEGPLPLWHPDSEPESKPALQELQVQPPTQEGRAQQATVTTARPVTAEQASPASAPRPQHEPALRGYCPAAYLLFKKPAKGNPVACVDNSTMVYDGKRDRLLLAETPWWKPGDGTLHAFGFKDREMKKLQPANTDLGKIVKAREMVYVEHADWVLFGEPYPTGAKESAKKYVRAYDRAKNRWLLLNLGGFPAGRQYCQGWVYDAKRKLVYVVNSNRWGVWALRLDPKTVKILTKGP